MWRGPINEVADDDAVAFLVAEPGLLDIVITEHVSDDHGCCRVCSTVSAGRARWPCNVRLLASRAVRVRDRRDGDAPS
ncbi:hypothetical protein AFB00_12300 [Pseudonocardia sp. HH130630-07]|nr:hypothetical protein AFB00_12300 [Pseudonocardia sp. HH130630-07]